MPQSELSKQISSYETQLRDRLSASRFTHTMGVAYTASALAMCHDCNMEKALIAGLLHDYAKCIPEEEQVRLCDQMGVKLSDTERQNPALVHGKLGAALVEQDFGVTDREILDAIRYHTTGRPDMSDLEALIFVADYIEPNRKALPNLRELRQIAFYDLEDCIYQICDGILDYLKSQERVIDPMTKKTRNYYKELLIG